MAEYNNDKLVAHEPTEAELRAQIAATQASLRLRLDNLTDEVRSEVHWVSNSVETSVLRVSNHVEASISRVADKVGDGVSAVSDNIQQGVHRVAERVDGTVAGFSDAVNLSQHVRQAPIKAVGLSVAAGFVGMAMLRGRQPPARSESKVRGFFHAKPAPAAKESHAVVPALLLSAAGSILRPMLLAAGRNYLAGLMERRQGTSDQAGSYDSSRSQTHRESAPPYQM